MLFARVKMNSPVTQLQCDVKPAGGENEQLRGRIQTSLSKNPAGRSRLSSVMFQTQNSSSSTEVKMIKNLKVTNIQTYEIFLRRSEKK